MSAATDIKGTDRKLSSSQTEQLSSQTNQASSSSQKEQDWGIRLHGSTGGSLLENDWNDRDRSHWYELCQLMMADEDLAKWYHIHRMEWQSLRLLDLPPPTKMFTQTQRKR